MRAGGDESWARLERDLDASAKMIAVGEEGWERRFEEVMAGMMPLRGVGRRLVALALVGELERRAGGKALKVTEELFARVEAMERSYERREKLQRIWEREGPARRQPGSRWREMTVLEQVAEDEKELAKEADGGFFAGLPLRGYDARDGARWLFEYAKSAARLFGIISF